MDSIVQKEKVCLVCRTTQNLECHHIFGGSRRSLSTEYGLTTWLCHEHHTGIHGVHFDKKFMQELKELGQIVFTEKYGDALFFQRFGKNYLNDDNKEDDDE